MPKQAAPDFRHPSESVSDAQEHQEHLPASPQTGSPNAVTMPKDDANTGEALRLLLPRYRPEGASSGLCPQSEASPLATSPNAWCGPRQPHLNAKQRRAAKRRARFHVPHGRTSLIEEEARACDDLAPPLRERFSDPVEIHRSLSAIPVHPPPTHLLKPRPHTAYDPLICDFISLLKSKNVSCALCAFYKRGRIAETHKLKRCSHQAESSEAQGWLTMFRSYRARGGGKGARCHACRFPLTLCWRTVYREQMDEWYGNEQEALEREDILCKEVQCVWVKAVQRFVTACMIVEGIGAGTGVSTLGAMVLEGDGLVGLVGLPSLKRTCLKHEIFNAYLSTTQEIRKLPSTKKYLLTSPSPNPTGASVPTRRSSRNERDTLHISNLPLLTSMDRLPAEIVDLIFRNIASPGTGLRHIAPFLRCGRRWFEHAVPFVWKRVCLLAITQECIDNKRRAL
ncbi:hypothetical protein CGCA056_v015076 [Colletotrichum aenigma]|uniref:uncharacterized protein n=1 Tax=Colletotrichum aenigma TaxID=1215731 RepID=UPI0018721E59|nr:uncharacterized protein CGCA056_v015076 [Colletotrichum aenigma]KAF5483165.1 hypothetical protein CGCA056_v015076 [Colletotrichum aenigma]